jgi:prevent-host-death family protein
MREQQPMTQTMKISDVRSQLNSLVNRVYRRETRVVVEKSGIPVAAIVSLADLARLDRLDRERAERFKVIDEMREAFAGVPEEELEREAERAVAEVRAEMRAEREQAAAAKR